MSVIGYDGKIRPKSVAVNYKPQGMMSPEQMERIHAAKPDYVSGVMKMFDSINANMSDTIGYFDKERKEREAVEHSEKKLDLNKRLSDIENNPDLTPAQKEEQRQAIAGEVESGSNPGKFNTIGRAMKNDLRAILQGSAERIQLEANRTEAGMRAANLEAGLNTVVSNANTDLQAWMVEQILKNPNLKLEDLQGLLEKRFDEFAGPDATNGLRPLELAEYKKNRSLWIGGNMVVFGKILGDKNREKNAQNIAVSSFAKAASAKTGSEAWNAGNDIAGQYVGNTIDENGQIQNANGTAIMWIKREVDKNVTEADRIIANATDANVYAAKVNELGADGAARWAASEIERAEKLLFDTRNFIQLSCDDAYKALEGAHGGKLMQAEKDYYKTFLQDNADALKKQLDKTVGQKKASAGPAAKKAEKEVGKNDFSAVRDFIRGKSVNLSDNAVKFFRKIQRAPEYMDTLENESKESGYTDEIRAGMRNVLFNDKYAALPEADRDEAFLRDCEVFITGLDMNRDAAQNLYDIERVLDAAGAMYGYKSDQYNRIAMFVFENFQREKNSMGNAASNHLDKWFLDGHSYSSKEGREILNANPRLREVYSKVLTLAQELPYDGSAWFDEMKKLEPIARQMVAYSGITSADGFQQGAVAAFGTAKKMSKEKAAALSEQTKQEYPESQKTMDKYLKIEKEYMAYIRRENPLPVGGNSTALSRRNYEWDKQISFWKDSAREEGFSISARSPIEAQDKFYAMLKKREDESREKAKRDEEGKRLEENLAEIKRRGLPTNVGAYTSFLKIGGYEVNEFGDIELGMEVGYKNDDTVNLRQSEEILRRHDELSTLGEAKRKREADYEANQERLARAYETRKFFKEVSAGELATKNYGLREDGTKKGDGWFGEIKLPDGSVMTEVSITIEKNGVSVDVPMITPMTTKRELDFLARTASTRISEMSKEDKKVFDGIAEKAVKWAEQRWAEKKSPYIMKGEEFVPLPKDEEDGEKK